MSDIISVDIECSSDTLEGKLISIGLVNYKTKEHFYKAVKFRHGLFCKPKSMMVNKISFQQLDDGSLVTLDELDKELCNWLKPSSIMMGRGVSYFDSKFIEKDLPKSVKLFSRRIFDLTGAVFLLSTTFGVPFDKLRGDMLEYAQQKTDNYLNNKLDIHDMFRHHALWDAFSNCFALDYLRTFRIERQGIAYNGSQENVDNG
ncbi:MAG: hypothetical protein E2O29_01505 [Deltaproteobacteria bacterium]|nr:MAG: hypothetical protein E2O29_01505 [Deltaproteobacteria bacterium]